jgi:hypothetical protein
MWYTRGFFAVTIAAAIAVVVVAARAAQAPATAGAAALTAADYVEIQQLAVRYSYAMDTGADGGEMLASLFAPDGVDPEEVWARSTSIPGIQLKLGKLRGTMYPRRFIVNHVIEPAPGGAIPRLRRRSGSAVGGREARRRSHADRRRYETSTRRPQPGGDSRAGGSSRRKWKSPALPRDLRRHRGKREAPAPRDTRSSENRVRTSCAKKVLIAIGLWMAKRRTARSGAAETPSDYIEIQQLVSNADTRSTAALRGHR